MTYFRISIDVDINKPPVDIQPLAKNEEITLGDLHGNALKLLFILVSFSVVEISEDDYNQVVRIYFTQEDSLTEEYLQQFNAILAKLKVNPASIRLIGDEFADRGSNDYITFKILEKLYSTGVSLEILISNHSIEFLQAYENYDEANANPFEPVMLKFNGHANSLGALNTLVVKKLVSSIEIIDSLNFTLTKKEIYDNKDIFCHKGKCVHKTFYEWQRRRLNILIIIK